jgi:hypothetical protein
MVNNFRVNKSKIYNNLTVSAKFFIGNFATFPELRNIRKRPTVKEQSSSGLSITNNLVVLSETNPNPSLAYVPPRSLGFRVSNDLLTNYYSIIAATPEQILQNVRFRGQTV